MSDSLLQHFTLTYEQEKCQMEYLRYVQSRLAKRRREYIRKQNEKRTNKLNDLDVERKIEEL